MKKFFLFIFASLLLIQNFSFSEETSPHTNKTPDFSPPTDLSGPVFPMEDVIGKPNEETNRFLNEFIKTAASLGLIISLIFIVAWFLKRMLNTRQEQANTTSIIKVIERRALSPKTAIYLLEVEGKTVVISESLNGVTRLTEYNSPEDEAEPQAQIPSAFSKLLDQDKKG